MPRSVRRAVRGHSAVQLRAQCSSTSTSNAPGPYRPRRRSCAAQNGLYCASTSLNLAPYDPSSPHRYEAEAERVSAALGNVVAVEHVGSTSVPGLPGKPTIDIAAGVPTLALARGARERMERLGYSYAGDHGLPQHVFRYGHAVPWRFIVHVVEFEGSMWRDFLAFRDSLRSDPDAAARYGALKESLLAERTDWYHGVDKASFIEPILERARANRGA